MRLGKQIKKMLDQGDMVWVDFNPVRGREQAGYRPALVLSSVDFHEICEQAIVCPITQNDGAWPFKVPLGEGEAVVGGVLVDQVRSVHRPSRGFSLIGRASPQLLDRVRHVLAQLTGLQHN